MRVDTVLLSAPKPNSVVFREVGGNKQWHFKKKNSAMKTVCGQLLGSLCEVEESELGTLKQSSKICPMCWPVDRIEEAEYNLKWIQIDFIGDKNEATNS